MGGGDFVIAHDDEEGVGGFFMETGDKSGELVEGGVAGVADVELVEISFGTDIEHDDLEGGVVEVVEEFAGMDLDLALVEAGLFGGGDLGPAVGGGGLADEGDDGGAGNEDGGGGVAPTGFGGEVTATKATF